MSRTTVQEYNNNRNNPHIVYSRIHAMRAKTEIDINILLGIISFVV